jgi:hypothetical protein
MATIGTLALTLSDWAKRVDPDGKTSRIVEILNQTNHILDDMLWVEGNLPTGHRTTIRNGLPEAVWRKLNYGVPRGKSQTSQVNETCGMLEVYSEVDKALADLNGNSAEFRLSEDKAFIEGMNQQLASALIYESEQVNPERITGLAPRFSSLTAADNADNIIDAGGTGADNTSIWLVVWGDQTCHGIFPRGSKAGLMQKDLGEQTVFDTGTPPGMYQAYRTHYKWDSGLSVRDWRYVVRICNLDLSELAGGSPPSLVQLLIRAVNKIPNVDVGRPAIYCNRAVRTWLEIQVQGQPNLALRWEDWAGKPVLTFRGIPIRTVDAIRNNEARVE